MRIGDDAARALERRLVRHLRSMQDISRVELARRMDLSPSTIGIYVDRLITSGWIREGKKVLNTAGRPATVLGLNPAAGHFVGVDIEGRQCWVTAVNFAQQVLGSKRIPIQPMEMAEAVLAKAEIAVASMAGSAGPLLGIAIGVPGGLDMENGVAVHYSHIRGWNNLPLRKRFETRFGVPVALENNIRAMALAEELFGHGRDSNNFICLGIRSGIAAGIVLDRHLYTGPNHLAGEIGNWPCGADSSLEQCGSLSAIFQKLETAIENGVATSLEISRGRLHLQEFIAAVRQNDPLVLDVLKETGRTLGQALAQMTLLLNPEKIIIAGPLADFDEELIRHIRDTMQQSVIMPHGRMPLVVGSELGEYAGALGAAALAVREWSPSVRNN